MYYHSGRITLFLLLEALRSTNGETRAVFDLSYLPHLTPHAVAGNIQATLAEHSDVSSIELDLSYSQMGNTGIAEVMQSLSSIVGLTDCIGSVDCVHIGWNRCPAYQKNIFKGSKGYPSVVFEVVSDHRRKLLSISYLHPGTRNNKYIVKFDAAVSNLHDRNLFLGRQEWTNVLTVESSITN